MKRRSACKKTDCFLDEIAESVLPQREMILEGSAST
jgi:hypothetical protein